MEKMITIKNIRSFAYCNHQICEQPIRGIVLFFHGLGYSQMENGESEEGRSYAEKGILYLSPYQNPWAWMNKQTVDFTDELVDVLFDAFGLPCDLPIVSTGMSMGGLSALVYTVYAKRTPVACVANCPVCDLPNHYHERADLPRTLYSAFGSYPGTMDEALRTASPLHLADKMPTSAVYHIFHCEEDKSVNKQTHSDRFVEKMLTTHQLSYWAVPGRGHCDLDETSKAMYHDCILKAITG